ncbi:hypothetical protein GCK32_004502 [Trichostrongylus colubriformis]|uniref:Uncharacterized protein n=1 Tax=Trichostrongylus colubriformis TaxID=6319 RepID=A0AAN8FI87_TRICO
MGGESLDVPMLRPPRKDKLIKRNERKINDTDCVQSYKVQFSNGMTPLYMFAIERQNFTRIYGTINEGEKMKPKWLESDKDEFVFYLKSCRINDTMPAEALKNFHGVLSCNRSPQPTQYLNRALRVSSTTPQNILAKLGSILKKKKI